MAGGYLRHPHIHADLLTFVAEDDVWVAPLAGGRAWRVSADHAPVSRPRFSPDGRHVAWTSRRDGDAEIYLAPVDGGPGRRLTYWGAGSTRLLGWADDGNLLAVTAAGQPFSHFTWAYTVPLDGGTPVRLPYGPVDDLARADGHTVLLTGAPVDYSRWKRYRGGLAGRIWIGPDPSAGGPPAAGPLTAGASPAEATGHVRILTELDGVFGGVALVAGRVAVLSDHDGVGELYSCQADGTDLRRHTEHDGRGFYARQVSTDGHRVIFQRFGELWLLDDLFGAARPLEITLGGARRSWRPHLVTADDEWGGLSCDHEGRASVIEVGGTVHWLTHREGPARVLSADPGVRARSPRVLGTSGQVVWVSDAGGADGTDALQVAPAAGSVPGTEPRSLAAGTLGRVDDLAPAPDGTTVAVAAVDGRLLLVDVASGDVHELAVSDDGPVCDLAYSPDSAWLAWSQPGPRPLHRIRLARLADRSITDVTDARFRDTDPVFTLDGRHLAFLSFRGFDPIYDAHTFDLSFPFGCRPYLVPLAATTPSPFAPTVAGRAPGDDDGDKDDKDDKDKDKDKAGDRETGTGKAGGDPADNDGGKRDAGKRDAGKGDAGKGDAGKGDGDAPPAVTVDTHGLPGRVVPLPVEEARYAGLRAVDGGLVWLRRPLSGVLGEDGAEPGKKRQRPSLERFSFAKRGCEQIVDELSGFDVSGDGKQLVVMDRGRVRVQPAGHRASDDESVNVDLTRARTVADPAARWRHAFAEAGRVVRQEFWTEDLSGVDWDGVLERYRPALDRIGCPGDFADLLSEVFGELGTSHAYVHGAPYHHDGEAVALLGADLEPSGAGRGAEADEGEPGAWRVTRVLPGESSDPRARSPLAAPGVAIRPGDMIVAVDGRPMDPAFGPAPLLLGTADKPVELTVRPGAGGEPRRVAVVPLSDDVRLRYQAWVADRRRYVREHGEKRIGYLHIPDMMAVGWAQFHRDLRVEMACDALIVDLRANGGGHVSQLVVEKLARRVIGWDVPRGMRPTTYPEDAPRGPVVAVIDENAGSDGDIIAAAIRSLGLGRLVGARTWGGVIGIDGWHGLIDGTTFTVPKYATWFTDRGWGLENHGVDPDVEVLPTPQDWAQGRDPQLETAVRLALDELGTRPPARPPRR